MLLFLLGDQCGSYKDFASQVSRVLLRPKHGHRLSLEFVSEVIGLLYRIVCQLTYAIFQVQHKLQ